MNSVFEMHSDKIVVGAGRRDGDIFFKKRTKYNISLIRFSPQMQSSYNTRKRTNKLKEHQALSYLKKN